MQCGPTWKIGNKTSGQRGEDLKNATIKSNSSVPKSFFYIFVQRLRRQNEKDGKLKQHICVIVM